MTTDSQHDRAREWLKARKLSVKYTLYAHSGNEPVEGVYCLATVINLMADFAAAERDAGKLEGLEEAAQMAEDMLKIVIGDNYLTVFAAALRSRIAALRPKEK